MFKILYRIKKWQDLKSNKITKADCFKSIVIDFEEGECVEELISQVGIDPKNIHWIQKSEYNLPDKIEPPIYPNAYAEIGISITWVVYFYKDIDWITVQLIR